MFKTAPDQQSGLQTRHHFLSGGGEMAKAIAATNWAETPLGPIEGWSHSLRTTVSLCLASNFPISLAWGPKRIQIYNDGYWPICGAKHPESLGQDFRECWASAWPVIGEAFAAAEAGQTRYLENQRMFLDRNGYLEETFFTFSFSPIRDESGEIGGLFHPVVETTARMLSERRTKALRDLAFRTLKSTSVEEACSVTTGVIGDYPLDLPFALLYLLDEAGEELQLAGWTGIGSSTGDPGTIRLDAPGVGDVFSKALDGAEPLATDDLPAQLGLTPWGPYPEQPRKALVLPVARAGAAGHAGILIAGISTRLQLDENYRSFCVLVAGQLATAIASAHAHEEECRRLEALAELDRARTQFFPNVSHEFRTPLTLILGPLEEMLARAGGAVITRDELAPVYRNTLRLLRLVNALLEFSRIEAGRAQPRFEATDLAAFTADLANSFRSAIETAGLRFVVDCPPLSAPARVDRVMWEKVVLNLLSNALKFTFTGEIRVTLRERNGEAEVQVADTGTGIPPEEIPQLFQRFHRVEGARGRSYEGTGIGLSLVQELVCLHSGSVRVQSTPDAGSTFSVTLPLGSGLPPVDSPGPPGGDTRKLGNAYVGEALQWIAEPNRGPVPIATDPERPANRPRILLADDNADMRQYIERLLATDYDVQCVRNGAEALQAALESPPALVLSDVMMPELDGFALLTALRRNERTRSIPMILLSGRAGEEARVEGLNAGADDYLIKPFSARELFARVRNHLSLAQLRAQNARYEELQRTTAAMEQQWRIYDTALSNTADHTYIFDVKGRFTYVNRTLLATWRKSLPEVIGKTVGDLDYPPELAAQVQEQVRKVVETGETVRAQAEYAGASGEKRWYDYIFVPVRAEGDRVEAVVGSSRDVTDQKNAEATERERQEQLRESARLESLGVMAGGIAHDFNNLLTSILGYASLLTENEPDQEDSVAGRIMLAAQRAADLTRQMLAFSGKGQFLIETIDVNKLIRDNLTLLSATLSRSVKFDLDLAPVPCLVKADAGQIQQIVMNLLINASEAIVNCPGNVVIRTALVDCPEPRVSTQLQTLVPAGRFTVLEVRDNGSGMSPATLRKIFDPFFTTKFTGRGLGLAAVLGIIKGHGGDLEVVTEPGVGTTFRVYLPNEAQEFPPQEPDAAIDSSFHAAHHTVLVVDDEATVLQFAVSALRSRGFSVLAASSAAEGLEILRGHPRVSLVLLDLTMPGMTGEQAIPKIREIDPNVPILVSSGFSEAEVAKRLAERGVAGVLQKPYKVNRILSEVSRLLAKTG